jgi:hypothetical protein
MQGDPDVKWTEVLARRRHESRIRSTGEDLLKRQLGMTTIAGCDPSWTKNAPSALVETELPRVPGCNKIFAQVY